MALSFPVPFREVLRRLQQVHDCTYEQKPPFRSSHPDLVMHIIRCKSGQQEFKAIVDHDLDTLLDRSEVKNICKRLRVDPDSL